MIALAIILALASFADLAAAQERSSPTAAELTINTLKVYTVSQVIFCCDFYASMLTTTGCNRAC